MHLPPHTSASQNSQGQSQGGEKRSVRSVLLLTVTKTAETVQEGPLSLVPEEPVPFLATTPSSQEGTWFEHFPGPLLPPIHQCSYD